MMGVNLFFKILLRLIGLLTWKNKLFGFLNFNATLLFTPLLGSISIAPINSSKFSFTITDCNEKNSFDLFYPI